MTKFDGDWTKIVDVLLLIYFWTSIIFFESVFIFFCHCKVEILDGDHRKWFIGQPMPKKLAGHCAIRDWDTIYVIGSPAAPSTKSVGTLEVFLFNITTSIWHTLPSSIIGNGNGPVAQRDFACSLSPDRSQIFVSGGKMDSGRSVNDFFAFYLRSETWWQLASSLEPRSGKFYDMHISPLFKFGFNPSLIDGILNVLPFSNCKDIL